MFLRRQPVWNLGGNGEAHTETLSFAANNGWQLPCEGPSVPYPRRMTLRSRHYDDWTVETWRIEPRLRPIESDMDEAASNPPLWKDLTLASIVAALLWIAAAAMFA